MNIAYLILGGNLGDRMKNLESASRLIQTQAGNVISKSDVFITAPWGNTEQPDFYNQALKIETGMKPAELLKALLEIEAANGRIRTGQKWHERTIDIDILFYNSEIVDEPHLKIPHPHLAERKFVLAPLAQIAGDFIHPVLQQSINDLLNNCKDTSGTKIIEPIS